MVKTKIYGSDITVGYDEETKRIRELDERSKQRVRALISGFYDIQKLRITTGNRIVALFQPEKKQLQNKNVDDLDERENIRILKVMEKEYRALTTYMEERGISEKNVTTAIKDFSDNLTFFKSDMDVKVFSEYLDIVSFERNALKTVTIEVKRHPMWDAFFAGVKGCGPLMAGVCLAYIDIDKARHASSLWKYAGLDVVVNTNTGEGEGRCRRHRSTRVIVDSNGEEREVPTLGYNPVLKTKLCGVLGSSFLRTGGKDSKYAKMYYDYRTRKENDPRYSEYSKGHLHAMANRYIIKAFLEDLWIAWRTLRGYDIGEPYAQAYLHRKPHGYNEAEDPIEMNHLSLEDQEFLKSCETAI